MNCRVMGNIDAGMVAAAGITKASDVDVRDTRLRHVKCRGPVRWIPHMRLHMCDACDQLAFSRQLYIEEDEATDE